MPVKAFCSFFYCVGCPFTDFLKILYIIWILIFCCLYISQFVGCAFNFYDVFWWNLLLFFKCRDHILYTHTHNFIVTQLQLSHLFPCCSAPPGQIDQSYFLWLPFFVFYLWFPFLSWIIKVFTCVIFWKFYNFIFHILVFNLPVSMFLVMWLYLFLSSFLYLVFILSCFGTLFFHLSFRIHLSSSRFCWDFDWNCFESVVHLGGNVHFELSVDHGHGAVLHLSRSSLMSFSKVYGFKSFVHVLYLYLGISLFLDFLILS